MNKVYRKMFILLLLIVYIFLNLNMSMYKEVNVAKKNNFMQAITVSETGNVEEPDLPKDMKPLVKNGSEFKEIKNPGLRKHYWYNYAENKFAYGEVGINKYVWIPLFAYRVLYYKGENSQEIVAHTSPKGFVNLKGETVKRNDLANLPKKIETKFITVKEDLENGWQIHPAFYQVVDGITMVGNGFWIGIEPLKKDNKDLKNAVFGEGFEQTIYGEKGYRMLMPRMTEYGALKFLKESRGVNFVTGYNLNEWVAGIKFVNPKNDNPNFAGTINSDIIDEISKKNKSFYDRVPKLHINLNNLEADAFKAYPELVGTSVYETPLGKGNFENLLKEPKAFIKVGTNYTFESADPDEILKSRLTIYRKPVKPEKRTTIVFSTSDGQIVTKGDNPSTVGDKDNPSEFTITTGGRVRDYTKMFKVVGSTKKFKGWSKDVYSRRVYGDKITVNAEFYEPGQEKYTVDFIDSETNELYAQEQVDKNANIRDLAHLVIPTRDGKIFGAWQGYDFNKPVTEDIVLRANWENGQNNNNIYEVKFKVEGKDFEIQRVAEHGYATIPQKAVNVPGKIFKKWMPNPETTIILGNTEFNAVLEDETVPEGEKVDVTIDLDGGKSSVIDGSRVVKIKKGTSINSIENTAIRSLLEKTPTKKGYIFTSWDRDFNENINENITIKALYERNLFKYRFVEKDQSGQVITVYKDGMKTKGETLEDEDFVPKKLGYKFIGWDYNLKAPINSDIDIVAKWEVLPGTPETQTVTIRFDLDGGEFKQAHVKTELVIKKGTQLPIMPKPVKEGYIFVSWTGTKNIALPQYENTVYKAKWQKAPNTSTTPGVIQHDNTVPNASINSGNSINRPNTNTGNNTSIGNTNTTNETVRPLENRNLPKVTTITNSGEITKGVVPKTKEIKEEKIPHAGVTSKLQILLVITIPALVVMAVYARKKLKELNNEYRNNRL